ncbi:MAG: hypothetical protein ACQESR_26170 [Planctomycetota bacterium]
MARLEKHLEAARRDLGDDLTNSPGQNVRRPGFVQDAVTLTKNANASSRHSTSYPLITKR